MQAKITIRRFNLSCATTETIQIRPHQPTAKMAGSNDLRSTFLTPLLTLLPILPLVSLIKIQTKRFKLRRSEKKSKNLVNVFLSVKQKLMYGINNILGVPS